MASIRRIDTSQDIERALQELVRRDSRLGPVIDVAGEIPLRRREPGFEGLARIVCGQQLSVASAAAIWRRLEATITPFEAGTFLGASDAALREAGLSAPKVRTLRAAARAELDGRMSFDRLAGTDPTEAHAAMTALPGIGPWTADIYLLFCVGHADIWPAGDLALQHAIADAFSLDARPREKLCRALAEPWSPWRGVAARLFWAYYAARRKTRDAVPA